MPSPTERFSAGSIARGALITAMALCAQWLENLLPAPIPGLPIRLGLANVFTLLLLLLGDRRTAVLSTLLRALMMVLITGNVSRLAYGLTGGLLSVCGMLLTDRPRQRGRLGLLGMSVTGAFLYNMGQLLSGLFFVGKSILAYIPWMGLLSIPCGALTAFLAATLYRYLPLNGAADKRTPAETKP